MDKNNIIGFVLIAAMLIGFSIWSQPSAEQKAEAARQDSIAAVTQQKAIEAQKVAAEKKAAEAKAAVEADSTALFHKALQGTDSAVVLKNSKVELTIGTKGATVEKAVIKNFTDREGNANVTLFDKKDQSLKFMLAAKETNINSDDLYFQPPPSQLWLARARPSPSSMCSAKTICCTCSCRPTACRVCSLPTPTPWT